ncbi:hypothetical protein [Polaribacter sp. IC073]|uniref:hypothetical protein n=1 Tax=Polaribacter sp. IC073 TaxID=2508540 RepID=UPI0011BE09E8|nr:hypothetical protein [Polaribacter sp. IC073]TXD47757.1 hypothetical protein ES045_10750 [Polaribacter sp. IC073]
MIAKNYPILFVVIILVSTAIAPSFALGEGNRNLLLIGVMSISPIIVIMYEKLDNDDFLLLMFMASIILFPLVFHPESMRWSTILYSCMFCLTFIAYKRLLYDSNFTVSDFQKLLKFLIFAYFFVLVIQQFCVLTGLPIFNISNYDPKTPWKLNALAAEPSHSARILPLLMYCYLVAVEIRSGQKYNLKNGIKKDKWVWGAFVWSMITMGSGAAFLFLGLFFLKIIKFRNLIPVIGFMVALLVVSSFLEIKALDRTYKTIEATLTFNDAAILKADHSAAMRIVPFMILSKMVGISSMNDWFGNGIDFTSTILSNRIPGVPKGATGGGSLQIWLEYGIISFSLFIFFSLITSIRKEKFIGFLFWCLLVLIVGVNNQIVWLFLLLFITNEYFKNTINKKNIL